VVRDGIANGVSAHAIWFLCGNQGTDVPRSPWASRVRDRPVADAVESGQVSLNCT
jgi:hypothetical protein